MPSAAGVPLVPAFSGLGAPYFDGDARAALVGLGRGTTRAHIVRAALDAMALQDVDVLEAMRRPGACYAPRLPETARRDRLDAWHDAVRRVRSRFPI